jgi:inosine/guanosine/xanthosine phosphorylase family protein
MKPVALRPVVRTIRRGDAGAVPLLRGHTISTLPFRPRAAHGGIADLILTNAAGGVNRSFQPGDLMLITDHIGLFCEPVLRGPNLDDLGPRFPDQSRVYDRELSDLARASAIGSDRPLREGVYVYCKGPQFETPAEIRLIAALGGDAVGMSTVPEAVAATHCGMRVLGISCIYQRRGRHPGPAAQSRRGAGGGRELSTRAVQLVETIIGKSQQSTDDLAGGNQTRCRGAERDAARRAAFSCQRESLSLENVSREKFFG